MESDEAVFARLRRGEVLAFDILYERYAARLLGFIDKRLGDRALAEDVLQEVFLAMAKAQNPSILCLRAWLYQIAQNLCAKQVRRTKHLVPETEHLAIQTESAEGQLAFHASRAKLQAAVEGLPVHLNVLYTLRAEGLSYDEIAAQLSLPLGTVKSRMHQLVTLLRDEVTK